MRLPAPNCSQGDAYVGVSAQALGVEGGPRRSSPRPGGLVHKEPARYGSLHHPGDQYAFDIFAQSARHSRTRRRRCPRRATQARVAVGESQSAFFLTTFADTFAPLGQFRRLSSSTAAAGAGPLDGPAAPATTSQNAWIRTDLDVPVFMFETQSDLVELGYAAAQQPDTDRIRTWEVAGTSHADAYIWARSASSVADGE